MKDGGELEEEEVPVACLALVVMVSIFLFVLVKELRFFSIVAFEWIMVVNLIFTTCKKNDQTLRTNRIKSNPDNQSNQTNPKNDNMIRM